MTKAGREGAQGEHQQDLPREAREQRGRELLPKVFSNEQMYIVIETLMARQSRLHKELQKVHTDEARNSLQTDFDSISEILDAFVAGVGEEGRLKESLKSPGIES